MPTRRLQPSKAPDRLRVAHSLSRVCGRDLSARFERGSALSRCSADLLDRGVAGEGGTTTASSTAAGGRLGLDGQRRRIDVRLEFSPVHNHSRCTERPLPTACLCRLPSTDKRHDAF